MLRISPFITIYLCFIAVVFGAAMGSFMNCAAWRIVHGEPIAKGRSHCDHCEHPLSLVDLIPVVGYIINKGKCRYCGKKLSSRHIAAEGVTALTFLTVLLRYDITSEALMWLTLACLLLVCAFCDLEGYIIPDRFIIAGLVIRAVFLYFPGNMWYDILDMVLGGFAVGGGLLLVVLIFEKIRKKEAMGGGDIKLLFLTGIYLGWKRNLLCLLISCVFGIIFGVISQKREKAGDGGVFPWGPSICAAGIVAMLWGQEIIEAYISLF